ncbi:MAG TPA: 23S rRNA (guanosine(2251)-2'-O)-methyltransferase RlmB [Clostridiales bacterium]|nr:23S rRNA (guanosine(2251)-2'-O)-methyltransferase RlmB [Clostridiales bacterium]
MRTVFGKNPVMEVLRSNKKIEKIYCIERKHKSAIDQDLLDLIAEKSIKMLEVSKNKLDALANDGNHQGLVAIVEDFAYYSLDDVLEIANQKNKKPFLVILDGITDVHNFGAIIRSCECAGVDGIIIPERRAAQINDTVAKTSAGALEYLPIIKVVNINTTIDNLKRKGFWIYGADMNGDKAYYEEKYDSSLALVIGGEGKGISRLTREKCDIIVEIPMYGKINSLNASCAATILIYEVIRQRG